MSVPDPLKLEVTLTGGCVALLERIAARENEDPEARLKRVTGLVHLGLELGFVQLAAKLTEEERAEHAARPENHAGGIVVAYDPPWDVEDDDELLEKREDEDEDDEPSGLDDDDDCDDD